MEAALANLDKELKAKMGDSADLVDDLNEVSSTPPRHLSDTALHEVVDTGMDVMPSYMMRADLAPSEGEDPRGPVRDISTDDNPLGVIKLDLAGVITECNTMAMEWLASWDESDPDADPTVIESPVGRSFVGVYGREFVIDRHKKTVQEAINLVLI